MGFGWHMKGHHVADKWGSSGAGWCRYWPHRRQASSHT
ncbi:hypothetical protein C4K03_5462 [Pseudomonas synxantha]|uniref:Uncharacterized protein n=1 Tax=Pseudomonas synxantha TaxID=47883 RepID=A0A3G7UG25_9PSED|nr:hypothetical protein C4K03_5462 [Pseudomonas synxantha]